MIVEGLLREPSVLKVTAVLLKVTAVPLIDADASHAFAPVFVSTTVSACASPRLSYTLMLTCAVSPTAKSADRLPPKRALNLPALTITVAEMVNAAARAGATGRIEIRPDAAVQAVVDGWPSHFVSRHAARLGIGPDAGIDDLVRDYLDHRGL